MVRAATIVTGATGFAGSYLLERLHPGGSIVGWCRPGSTPGAAVPGITWQTVDIRNARAVFQAMEDARPARVYHLAGAPSVSRSWVGAVPYLQTNTLGTHHLLEAVRKLGLNCRVLVVTSAQIYEASDDPLREDAPLRPSNPYGLSKLAQDRLALATARDDGLDVVVARPFNHTGPRQRPGFVVADFARQIAMIERGLMGATLAVGNLEARRDLTDVRDVVEAYVRIMEHGETGSAYNVCSGRAWRVQDLLDELLHLSPAVVSVAVDPTRFRPIDVPIVQGDASRLCAELGWVPSISIERTLADTLDWWRDKTVAAE